MIDKLIASGVVPDVLLRWGAHRLMAERLVSEKSVSAEAADLKRWKMVQELKNSPVAIETDKANDQHYQVPTEFFKYVLGPRMKYSCALWDKATHLAQAEDEMLAMTVARAEIQDGMDILELGCGWGSVTLYMAEKFPQSKITAVSNSKTQREYILSQANEKGFKNVDVITANVAHLKDLPQKYDRVVSVEMFEHMRNYRELLERIHGWLKPDGKLFVHIFVHREYIYKFEAVDESDWMSKYFFSGGIMPSEHLLYYFQDHMVVEKHWRVGGHHYSLTSDAWLKNMDKNREAIMKCFTEHYGASEAKKWFHYWRVFFIACDELWNFKDGNEWFVAHYLFNKQTLQ
jgi:cyclopropane-fatty-acyl-phospholipid synthase